MTVAIASARQNQPMVGETTTKISDHVWAIMGFLNIAIVANVRHLPSIPGWSPGMEPPRHALVQWTDCRYTGLVALIFPLGPDTRTAFGSVTPLANAGRVVEGSNSSGEKWREGKRMAVKPLAYSLLDLS